MHITLEESFFWKNSGRTINEKINVSEILNVGSVADMLVLMMVMGGVNILKDEVFK
jgi:hypothetical protein